MPNIWIFLVVIISSLIKGITGFGFALFSFPLLLFWYSPKEIIPVLMICNLIASILIVLQRKEHKLLDKNSYLLISAGGVFTIAGVVALSSTTGEMLVKLSGVFFIGLTFYSIRTRNKNNELPSHNYFTAGALIGFLTGAVSVSGPPLALFLNRAKVSNRKFREIFAAFSVVTAVIAIIGYFQAGMITAQILKTSLMFSPILLAGTIVGKRLNYIMSINSFQSTNIVLTLIASILLIVH
ncbi:sulfite exporter TauE/SafE family protein [Marinilabilia sp.]|uniref:sulfite exporter TauE/SafE family protein n=1 Tax=Marinilabilia sp. TaxID=2021252 RepID=UPI0025BC4C05|nr:sulfite exporter TauE/SafE family protein [Marinilabilia sp.]